MEKGDGRFLCAPPLTSSSLRCNKDIVPFLWVLGEIFTTQPFESLIHSGGGWSWRTPTLGLGETGIGQQKRLGTPFSCPSILLAPVPEAVWVTSSHKHALFLRKWKVSEVWWGAGCLQQQHLGLPFSYSPVRRDPTGAPGAPAFSAFTTLVSDPGKSGKVGRGCLSRCRALQRHLAGGGQGHTALCVSSSLLPPRGISVFSLFSPSGWQKADIWPSSRCHSCSRCHSQDFPGVGVTRDTAEVVGIRMRVQLGTFGCLQLAGFPSCLNLS